MDVGVRFLLAFAVATEGCARWTVGASDVSDVQSASADSAVDSTPRDVRETRDVSPPTDVVTDETVGPTPECAASDDAGAPMRAPLGARCLNASQCASGVCTDWICSRRCAIDSDCPQAWTCDATDAGARTCRCRTTGSEICDGLDNDCDGRVDVGASCAGAASCRGGACSCSSGVLCAARCIDPRSDGQNCGVCGNACPPGTLCDDGSCAPLDIAAMVMTPALYCVVRRSGQVWCGGRGPIGNGAVASLTPARARPLNTVTSIASLAAGGSTAGFSSAYVVGSACGVDLGGSVRCWGRWVGDGAHPDRCNVQISRLGDWLWSACSLVPTRACDLADVRQLALGVSHGCALRSDGSVWCWGSNTHRELGDGTTMDRATPVRAHVAGRFVQIASGRDHVCALRDDGTVACWGDNYAGQLGIEPPDRDWPPRPREPNEVAGLTDVVQLSLTAGSSCVRLRDGTVRCWGAGSAGQLGDGTGGDPTHPARWRSIPAPVAGLTDVLEIAAGGLHMCARRADGTVWCWGEQAPDGVYTVGVRVPTRVPGVSNVERIWSGGFASCALVARGDLMCWGLDSPAHDEEPASASRATPAALRW